MNEYEVLKNRARFVHDRLMHFLGLKILHPNNEDYDNKYKNCFNEYMKIRNEMDNIIDAREII